MSFFFFFFKQVLNLSILIPKHWLFLTGVILPRLSPFLSNCPVVQDSHKTQHCTPFLSPTIILISLSPYCYLLQSTLVPHIFPWTSSSITPCKKATIVKTSRLLYLLKNLHSWKDGSNIDSLTFLFHFFCKWKDKGNVYFNTLLIPLNELALSILNPCSPSPPHLNKHQNHSKIIADKIAKLHRAFVHLKAELSYSFLAPGQ